MASSFDNASISAYGDRMQIFGLGSQWDTKTILEAELNMLQLRQQPYYTKKADYESDKQTWTALKTSLTNFNNIVNGLKNLSTDSKSVSLSEEGFVSATATGSAIDASYSISVQQLATKHRVMSDQVSSDALGLDETVQINGVDLTLTADMDVKGIATAINDGSYGVNAVVLDNRLVLTAKQSGSSKAITFSDSTAWETIGLTQSGIIKNELQAAQGSKFTVNGIQMTGETNTFNEVDGLTINLSKVTTSDIEINVARTADEVVEKLRSLVDSYNKVIGNINSLAGEKGVLQGESIPRNLKRQMNNLLFSVTDSGTMLYQLGISLDKDAKNGTIKLDESALRDMYDTDPQKVQKMLTGTEGFAGKLYDVIDSYAKSNGMIQSEIDGLDNRIKRIDDTLENYERQFERQKESLIMKYAMFETMMSSMTLQSQYIEAQLGSLSGNSEK